MSKISDLVAASDEIRGALERAERDLRRAGRQCNGWGILASPHDTRSRIQGAIGELKMALSDIDKIRWPTDAEYDALELEHNRR